MIAGAAIVLAILPFVFFRGAELIRALRNQFAVYAFATGVWVFARTVGASDFDPYIAIVFIGVVQLALIALQLATTKQLNNPATRFAVAAALVYAIVLPAQLRSVIDGDEPFYLLVTESIVKDHDLDLANQYRDIAHTDTGRPDLVPQLGDPKGPHGEQYSRHEPFLPLLMVPGYALFGLPGALATIALFGVLLVRSLVRWFEDEGISDATIRTLMPLIIFGPPLLFYAVRIWPEVPAAFCFVEALRGVRQRRAQRWIPALLALVMLKLRFVLIGVMLVPFVVRERKRALIALSILALPMLVIWIASGSATSVHSWRELMPVAPMPYLHGLFGLILDGAAGIAFQAPLYLLGIFALARWRSMPEGFRLGAIASMLYLVTLLPRAEWHGGWSPPLRYIVVFIPLLALGAAALYEQSQAARAWLAPIAIWTIGLTVHGIAEPWRLFHIASGENAVGEWLSAMYQSDFSRLFPSFIRPNFAAVVGAVGFVVVFVFMIFRGGTGASPVHRADRRGRLSLHVSCATALVLFFHFGRLPGDRIEFEDTHVIHHGGELYPTQFQVARFLYRGGWLMKRGDSMSFLAKRGSYILFYTSTGPAVIEIGGKAVHLDTAPMAIVDIPSTGRVTLTCVDGNINLDRMELR
jgi:hypothetical protein